MLDTFQLNNVASGQYGGLLVASTNPITGSFSVLTIIEDTVFTALDTSLLQVESGSNISDFVFPVGFTMFSTFTSFQLASGKILAYRVAPSPFAPRSII